MNRQTKPVAVEVACDPRPEGLVLRVSGQAGFRQAEKLGEELSRATLRQPDVVLLDLSGLSYLSSPGIAALIAFKRAAQRHGGRVVLTGLAGPVLSVLRRARLDAVFDIREAEPELALN